MFLTVGAYPNWLRGQSTGPKDCSLVFLCMYIWTHGLRQIDGFEKECSEWTVWQLDLWSINVNKI